MVNKLISMRTLFREISDAGRDREQGVNQYKRISVDGGSGAMVKFVLLS